MPELDARNLMKVEAVKRLLALAPLSLAAGAGLRGLFGARNFVARNLGPGIDVPQRHTTIPLAVPEEEEEEPAVLPMRRKVASLQHLAELIAKHTGIQHPQPAVPGQPMPSRGAGGYIVGDDGTSLSSMPFMVAGAPLIAAGGLYGGYKITDWLLDKARKGEVDSEVSEAEKEYNSALRPHAVKAASTEPDLSAKLDALYDELQPVMEKQATGYSFIPGSMSGAYLASLLGMAAISGAGTYNWSKKHSKQKLLEEAYKRRHQQLYEQFPTIARVEPYAAKKQAAMGPAAAADAFLNNSEQQRQQREVQLASLYGKKPAKPAAPPPAPKPPTVLSPKAV